MKYIIYLAVALMLISQTSCSIFNKEKKGNPSPILSTTIDAILDEANFGSVGLFHIDVEGFEIEAIMLNEKLNVKKDDEVFLAFKASDVIISKVLND